MSVVSQKVDLKFGNSDWKSETKPTWCPGCGDYGVLSATKKALVALQRDPKDTVVASGIGCSSNFPHFLGSYGIHTLHGRIGPYLTSIKVTNPHLTVIGAGGDGDGLGIGIGGLIHAARRNLDVTYVIMDNQIYGLTTGQTSPTSRIGHKTKSTPEGNIENPLNPIAVGLAAGATFVARAFSGDGKHFAEIMKRAIAHKGFSFVDALSPCVTFNRFNTYDYFRERVFNLDETDHDTTNILKAYERAYDWDLKDKVPVGIYYEVAKPTYEDQDPAYVDQDPAYKSYKSVIDRGAIRPQNHKELVGHLY